MKLGRYVVGGVVVLIGYIALTGSVSPPTSVSMKKGGTFQTFVQPLSFVDRVRVKRYLIVHRPNTQKIQLGTYAFTGSYSPSKYIAAIQKGPEHTYVRYTLLEGRSIYDVDADMVSKGLIAKGDFVRYVQDATKIESLSHTYSFLKQTKSLSTLEGFLYPDTYFLNPQNDAVPQLISASLQRFNEKIMPLWKQDGANLQTDLKPYSVQLSLPGMLTLASIIEREERNVAEKPTIAGLFINRLSKSIALGADVTVCYGLQAIFAECTPSFITSHIQDTTNAYNTRVTRGLPPTPISSVTAETVNAILHFTHTPYLYYLHDSSGHIHYAETNTQHEQNKRTYLQ